MTYRRKRSTSNGRSLDVLASESSIGRRLRRLEALISPRTGIQRMVFTVWCSAEGRPELTPINEWYSVSVWFGTWTEKEKAAYVAHLRTLPQYQQAPPTPGPQLTAPRPDSFVAPEERSETELPIRTMTFSPFTQDSN